MSPPRRPRLALWYTLSALLIAGAIALPLILIVPVVTRTSASLQSRDQFIAPGSLTVQIDEPGVYSLDYVYRGTFVGQIYATSPAAPSIQATLTRDADGAQILTRPTGMSGTFVVGDTQGMELFHFRVDDPGVHTIDVVYAPASAGGPNLLMAFGEPIEMMELILPIVLGALGTIVLLLAGIATLILTIVRHARAGPARSPA